MTNETNAALSALKIGITIATAYKSLAHEYAQDALEADTQNGIDEMKQAIALLEAQKAEGSSLWSEPGKLTAEAGTFLDKNMRDLWPWASLSCSAHQIPDPECPMCNRSRRLTSYADKVLEVVPWQKCPGCDGHGMVMFPPFTAAGQPWSGTATGPWKCECCHGARIIAMLPHEAASQKASKETT